VVTRDKLNWSAFMSINRTRPGHSSLKARLSTSTFNIVSTVEYECGDRPQTEEHIFRNCKLNEDQSATVMIFQLP
jgi:hypothetical protein